MRRRREAVSLDEALAKAGRRQPPEPPPPPPRKPEPLLTLRIIERTRDLASFPFVVATRAMIEREREGSDAAAARVVQQAEKGVVYGDRPWPHTEVTDWDYPGAEHMESLALGWSLKGLRVVDRHGQPLPVTDRGEKIKSPKGGRRRHADEAN